MWLLPFEQHQQTDHPNDQEQHTIKILVIHRASLPTPFSR